MKACSNYYDGTLDSDDEKLLLASSTQNGLMSKEDKAKLDSLVSGGNSEGGTTSVINSIEASKVTQDATHRFVTDTEKTTWNAKASTTVASTTANGLMSKEDKTKLDGIATNANNYTHPDAHPATMITEDTTHRFVTDTEKASWNSAVEQLANTVKTSEVGTKEFLELNTTTKTIIGAINELKAAIDSLQTV